MASNLFTNDNQDNNPFYWQYHALYERVPSMTEEEIVHLQHNQHSAVLDYCEAIIRFLPEVWQSDQLHAVTMVQKLPKYLQDIFVKSMLELAQQNK